jgi:hypothetical protein
MLPKSIEAGRLLGPPMSVASLLMPIAPIIGLHGGAILTLLNHRSGAQGVPMWGSTPILAGMWNPRVSFSFVRQFPTAS